MRRSREHHRRLRRKIPTTTMITARSALRSFLYRARSRRRRLHYRCRSVSNGSSIRSITRAAALSIGDGLHSNRALHPRLKLRSSWFLGIRDASFRFLHRRTPERKRGAFFVRSTSRDLPPRARPLMRVFLRRPFGRLCSIAIVECHVGLESSFSSWVAMQRHGACSARCIRRGGECASHRSSPVAGSYRDRGQKTEAGSCGAPRSAGSATGSRRDSDAHRAANFACGSAGNAE